MQRCVLNLKSKQTKCAVLPTLVQSNNIQFFLEVFCNFAKRKAVLVSKTCLISPSRNQSNVSHYGGGTEGQR